MDLRFAPFGGNPGSFNHNPHSINLLLSTALGFWWNLNLGEQIPGVLENYDLGLAHGVTCLVQLVTLLPVPSSVVAGKGLLWSEEEMACHTDI